MEEWKTRKFKISSIYNSFARTKYSIWIQIHFKSYFSTGFIKRINPQVKIPASSIFFQLLHRYQQNKGVRLRRRDTCSQRTERPSRHSFKTKYTDR